MGRSGSTLLDRMLGQVPGTASVGELFLLLERGRTGGDLCGCEVPLADCPFWTEVLGRVFDGTGPVPDAAAALALQQRVDRNRYLPRIASARLGGATSRADTDRFAELLRRLYRAIGEVSGAAVVIDSSKHVSTAFLLHRARVDVRLIHLVRDPRGMAYSWTKQVARPEAGTDAEMDRFPPARSAARWLGYNALFEALDRLVPSTHLFYEDLVQDPSGQMGRVLRDLGLPTDAAFDFLSGGNADLAFAHTVAGNPMRFSTGPLRIRVDDEWRTAMPAGQRRVVSVITAPLLTAYGYLGRRRDPAAHHTGETTEATGTGR